LHSSSCKYTDIKPYLYYNVLIIPGSVHQASGAVGSDGVTRALILQRHVTQPDWETKAASRLESYSIASGSWNRTAFEACRLVMSHYTSKSMCRHQPEFIPSIQSVHILYNLSQGQKK